jgi:hypothetical protein
MGKRKLFRNERTACDEGWAQKASGGHHDVAYRTSLVEACDSGGVRRTAHMRVSLHRPWSLPLESFSPFP